MKGVEDKRNRLCAFEMAVKLKSTHRLEKVIHVVSQNWENIDPADIVLTYRDVRLFPTSTLKSLNIEEDESLCKFKFLNVNKPTMIYLMCGLM